VQTSFNTDRLAHALPIPGADEPAHPSGRSESLGPALDPWLRLAEWNTPPDPDPVLEASFFPPEKATEGAFPNDFNVYLSAILTYQPGRIAVVRGKAPIALDTRDGEPVTAPQDLRYWSLCNNTNVFPFPVVACKADFETALDD
jgi:hypothetical protein